jgi:hypothetical protein
MSKKGKVPRKVGDVVAVPLGDGTYGFGRVLQEPLMAFYDLRKNAIPGLQDVLRAPVAFIVYVMNFAVTDGVWQIIGKAPLNGKLLDEPLFFKKDSVSGALSVYRDSTGEERPASREECETLERAAVWEPSHVVDRLVDYFAGRPNKWLESMRP